MGGWKTSPSFGELAYFQELNMLVLGRVCRFSQEI